jgi:hypothetical protein
MTGGVPVALPATGPAGASAEQWQAYANYARESFQPDYVMSHRYELRGTKVLPGLDVLDRQSAATVPASVTVVWSLRA